jgi:lipopolysaccharide/colanic/teichoic acid biosynthesis glycosyltransferase
MKEESVMAIIIVLPVTMMIVWFCKTVAQGSISFTFKALGLHFEVKKGSQT